MEILHSVGRIGLLTFALAVLAIAMFAVSFVIVQGAADALAGVLR